MSPATRQRPAKKIVGGSAEGKVYSEKKDKYFRQANALFDEYNSAMVMSVDNVQSNQMQKIRIALRGKAVVLMGKNTALKKVLAQRVAVDEPSERDLEWYEAMVTQNLLYKNVGLIMTNCDLKEIKDIIDAGKIQAPARQGAISPVDVTISAGNTGLEPTKTAFFQALNITTKITKGTVEILKDEIILSVGDKVGSSEATLLQMLNIKPFFYGMICMKVYDQGSTYGPEILEMTDEIMKTKFAAGISNITAISLGLGYTTKLSIAHVMMNSFKNVLAVSIGTDYTFEKHDGAALKEAILSGKSLGGGGGGGGGGAAAAPVEEAKAKKVAEPEPEEEDDDMGMGLFD